MSGLASILHRRMRANDMQRAPEIDNTSTVQVKRNDRRTSGRRHTDDERIRLIPGEVIVPSLKAWMEQRDGIATRGIKRCCLDVFVTVATLTSEREIFLRGATASISWDDVIDGKSLSCVILRTQAILTTTIGSFSDDSS